jgi:hypothetical protein
MDLPYAREGGPQDHEAGNVQLKVAEQPAAASWAQISSLACQGMSGRFPVQATGGGCHVVDFPVDP